MPDKKIELVEEPINAQCGYCYNKGLICPLFKMEIINLNRQKRRDCRKYISRTARKAK